MILQQINRSFISIPSTLKFTGLLAGTLGLLVVLVASLAYIPQHPEFSLINTFLSTIGDTPGWPQVLFNSGTLLVSPLRYIVLMLFAMRLYELGAGRSFKFAVLVIGFISTFGTVLMTAIPFSLAPSIHKVGIGLYFLGIVFLQSMVFFKQWSMKAINRLLPILSMVMVIIFIAFLILLILYEQGVISRSGPVFFEWLCFFSSITWVYTQSVMLGKSEK